MSIQIRLAVAADLAVLVPLFDAYRVFYKQSSDVAAAESFLSERFAAKDSTIFLAENADGLAIGFTQLFPSYSSVAMRRIFVLNDLYVAEAGRRSGAGRALLERAHVYAGGESAVRVSLRTAVDNLRAQKLYDSVGYRRDEVFYAYDFAL